jgi:hypothetical protein
MNDTAQTGNTDLQHPSIKQGGAGTFSKETEILSPSPLQPETPHLTEIGKDIELTSEVTASGVTQTPTVVTLPPNIEQLGVQVTGHNVPIGTGRTIDLPLSDDLILEGLHQKPETSFKLLALWCERQLKKIGIVIKIVGGKPTEVPVS